MDIAEIRKKARSVKSKESESTVAQATASPVTSSSEEPLQTTSSLSVSPRPTEVVAVSSLTNNTQTPEGSLVVPLARAESRNSVDQLFSWSLEAEIATIDSYGGNLAVELEKAETDCRQWLAFMLGAEEYSLDIVSIREIIKPRDITDIPRVPGFLLGIISLRGNIIPIFDLKRRLHLGVSEINNHSRIIVCQEGERFAGLLVDRISQVVSMPSLNIEPPPAILTGIDRELVSGVGRLQGKMMILLHLSSVLNIELT